MLQLLRLFALRGALIGATKAPACVDPSEVEAEVCDVVRSQQATSLFSLVFITKVIPVSLGIFWLEAETFLPSSQSPQANWRLLHALGISKQCFIVRKSKVITFFKNSSVFKSSGSRRLKFPPFKLKRLSSDCCFGVCRFLVWVQV